MIIDDDHAGAFGFESEKFKVQESDGRIDLTVWNQLVHICGNLIHYRWCEREVHVVR